MHKNQFVIFSSKVEIQVVLELIRANDSEKKYTIIISKLYLLIYDNFNINANFVQPISDYNNNSIVSLK